MWNRASPSCDPVMGVVPAWIVLLSTTKQRHAELGSRQERNFDLVLRQLSTLTMLTGGQGSLSKTLGGAFIGRACLTFYLCVFVFVCILELGCTGRSDSACPRGKTAVERGECEQGVVVVPSNHSDPLTWSHVVQV